MKKIAAQQEIIDRLEQKKTNNIQRFKDQQQELEGKEWKNEIYVKTLTGKTLSFNWRPMSVKDLKRAIHRSEGIPSDQ